MPRSLTRCTHTPRQHANNAATRMKRRNKAEASPASCRVDGRRSQVARKDVGTLMRIENFEPELLPEHRAREAGQSHSRVVATVDHVLDDLEGGLGAADPVAVALVGGDGRARVVAASCSDASLRPTKHDSTK